MLEIVSKKSSTAKKAASIPETTSSKSSSWISRHEPSTLSEVPVHSTKVKSTKEWLKKALIANSEKGPVHVLAMCGNSGCCKSTAIELICKEMQVEIVVWNEGMIDSAANGSFQFSGRDFGDGFNDNGRDLFRLGSNGSRFSSRKEDVLDDFAVHSKYPSLGLMTKKPSHQTSSKHERLDMILERSRSQNTSNSSTSNKIVLIHDPPQLSPFGNSSSSSSGNSSKHRHSSTVSEAEALYSFLLHMGCPVVLIVSDVSGRDEFHYAAERCLPTSIRDSVCFESAYFPPITELKIIKILERIAKAEGLLSRVSHSQLETLAVSSGGDLRHSILQLQLLVEANPRTTAPTPSCSSSVTLAGVIDLTQDSDSELAPTAVSVAVSPPAKKRRKQESDHIVHLMADHSRGMEGEALSEYTRRDLSFSGMHSAAKLLSAKLDDNGRLDFKPDEVIERSELGSDLMLAFLQGNCIDNFMEKCRCLYSVKNSASAVSGSSSGTGVGAIDMMSDEELPPDVDQEVEYFNSDEVSVRMTAPVPSVGAVTEESVDMTCLEQLERAFDSYSDVDVLLSRKYEPGSNNVDRDSGIFPDAYVAAIQSRAAAVSRGVGFNTVYEQARSSGTYKAAFLGLKRPKILNMRTAVVGMKQRLNEIREEVVSLHHYSSTNSGSASSGGNEQLQPTLHSLSLNSDLILSTVPLYRAIKAAQRERNPYHTLPPIFSEWIDWKIDTLQQQQHASAGKIVAKESTTDSGGHMQAMEIDFSSSASIEDDIVDDD